MSILFLSLAMIPFSFSTALVAAVGMPVLKEAGPVAARVTAIALSSLTAGAYKEHRMAFVTLTNPLPQNYFATRRHTRPRRGLDNGNGFVAL